jgi:hypothetical protein
VFVWVELLSAWGVRQAEPQPRQAAMLRTTLFKSFFDKHQPSQLARAAGHFTSIGCVQSIVLASGAVARALPTGQRREPSLWPTKLIVVMNIDYIVFRHNLRYNFVVRHRSPIREIMIWSSASVRRSPSTMPSRRKSI